MPRKPLKTRCQGRLAEGVGFEPTDPTRESTVFETAPIDLSGTPPHGPEYPCSGASVQIPAPGRRSRSFPGSLANLLPPVPVPII